ncbi:alpha-N-acetylglucosaminidase TIM-barrel domain-containing protein [Sphingomonas sp. H39-1-10]|uniref:alpha-N-acetylglucosaminidase n=1 Tax=Sphingomonas pollutisoli TaxID=3030829 RepID=UPI0023B97047|nr:alpha-N-acetylglucosaminidase [Sphingomonas pollutisoli]MDF0486526.1 alpha-N-acetylglucosaminidase TIM-barrel domain-containing protein [Sphingomonas pollutisoli]
MKRPFPPCIYGLLLLAAAGAAQAQPRDTFPARESLGRLGIPAGRITLAIRPAATPYYRVRVAAGRMTVEGSSAVALVHGAAQYLQRHGRLSVSWEGRRVAPLTNLPAGDTGPVASAFTLRTYLNTCTFGYTTPWWTWRRWSDEIDWMAARGIDTPLAMEGQDYVWRALWRDQGLDDATIAAGLSAAPFLPWQRMGNIAGYRAPLPAGWIEKKHRLQLRILARMRDLGMKPILPAFSGYVPKAFAERHPEARIYRMRAWEGFAPTYWLDPSDPLFATLAKRFTQLYTQTYGAGDYYLADAFNEMVPPIAEDGSDASAAKYGDSIANSAATRAAALPAPVRDARLAAYGEKLFQSVTAAAPGATWVMQGWLFGADKTFWTPEAIRAFLSRVPDARMLVLDIGNDRYPGIWRTSGAFDGKNWVYGYVHNYGGSNPVYGDLGFYRDDLAALATSPVRGKLTGFGLFPEGLHSNSVVYTYAYDLAWGEDARRPVAEWIADYARARYGSASPGLIAAWSKVIAGAYSTRYWTPRWWQNKAGAYLFFKRPTLAGADYPAAPGDPAALRDGIAGLLASRPRQPAPLFTYDLVDFARHYASLKLDARLRGAVAAYAAGDVTRGDAAAAAAARLAREIDALIGNQQETLGSWIADARAYGDTRAEKDAFEEQAKAIVTVWGGEGNLSDYASRAWQGLYAGYYLPRWQIFLAAQRKAALAHQPFDEAAATAAVKAWEQGWLRDGRVWPRRRPAAPLAGLGRLLADADQP